MKNQIEQLRLKVSRMIGGTQAGRDIDTLFQNLIKELPADQKVNKEEPKKETKTTFKKGK